MDGTLTESRQPASAEINAAMKELIPAVDVIVVSGAAHTQVDKQIPIKSGILAQNGNWCHAGIYWQRMLTDNERWKAAVWIKNIIDTYKILNNGDLVEDRGGQISFSLVGHNALSELKASFDPDGFIRHKILKDFPLPEELSAAVGGTTNIDIFRVDCTKGWNVREYIRLRQWNSEECLYIGDRLMPGGNDESVIGACETVMVTGPLETLEILKLYA